MTTMTPEQQEAFLKKLHLSPAAATLAVIEPSAPAQPAVTLAPKGVDPHTMPVADIVFDPRLLDGFPVLEGSGLKAASDHVFAQYRSAGRDPNRHPDLHRRISQFIGHTRLSRKTGGMVKEKVKVTREQRDLAKVLASHNITAADLAAALKPAE